MFWGGRMIYVTIKGHRIKVISVGNLYFFGFWIIVLIAAAVYLSVKS